MADQPDKIKDDVVVSLQYRLWLEDEDELVEESAADDPLMYLHGHDNIIPGLEAALEGLKIGDERTVVIEPEDAYGEYDPEEIDELPRDTLPDELTPEIGVLLSVIDEDDNEYIAQILEIDDEIVTLDFNHPMAGKRLRFEIEVTDLREPSEEELDHGHVHEDEHHHH